MGTLTTITGPAAEPLTPAQLRLRHHLLADVSDAELDEVIASVRTRVETYLRCRLITQTVRLTLDGFPAVIEVPVPQVQSIEAINYVDGAGATQTLSGATYRLIASQLPFRIAPVYGEAWPATRDDFGAVTVDLIVGYGDAATDVPADIIQAMYLLAGHEIQAREAVSAGGAVAIPLGVTDILGPHRFWI